MIRFLFAEWRWLLSGFLLTAFSGFGQTYFIGLSNTALRDAFSLSHGELAALYSGATLTSAVVLLEFGKIVDRVSEQAAAMIAVFGLASACLLLAGAFHIAILFVAFLGLRLFGQGMMSHVAMTATGRWFDAQRGRAISIVSLGYPISEALLPLSALAVFLALGLRGQWLVSALFLMLVTAPMLFALLSKSRVPTGGAAGANTRETTHTYTSWRRADLLREPVFFIMLLGIMSPAFMVTGLFFHQQHLEVQMSWQLGSFALAFPAFAVVQIAASLITGGAIDRLNARRLLPVYLLPMACAFALPFVFEAQWLVFVIMILVGMTGGAAATIMGAIWPELFGTEYLGEVRALAFSAMVASSAASPVLIGLLIDFGIPIQLQLAAMGVYALLASALMALIQPRLSAIAEGRAVRP